MDSVTLQNREMMESKFNEYELLYMIRSGDENAFLILYQQFLPLFLSAYTSIGSNSQYVELQECLQHSRIALSRAIKSYRDDMFLPFHSYLKLVIVREYRDLANRERMHKSYDNERILSLSDYYVDSQNTLENYISVQSNDSIGQRYLVEKIAIDYLKLSEKERRVIISRLKGYSYSEIAEKEELSIKKVDNIIQKVRKKTHQLLSSHFEKNE